MNNYLNFWNLKEPVFISKKNTYFDIASFDSIRQRMLLHLSIGMNCQFFYGPTGSGKTTFLKCISKSLDISQWDCLYSASTAENFEKNDLFKHLLRFIDTNFQLHKENYVKELIRRLEKLAKSDRKILVLIDLLDPVGPSDIFTHELKILIDICHRHQLPLYFICAARSIDLGDLPNSNAKIFQSRLIRLSSWHTELPEIKTDELRTLVNNYLENAALPAELIPNEILNTILRETNGNLQKISLHLESLLIDAYLYADKNIGLENINRVLNHRPAEKEINFTSHSKSGYSSPDHITNEKNSAEKMPLTARSKSKSNTENALKENLMPQGPSDQPEDHNRTRHIHSEPMQSSMQLPKRNQIEHENRQEESASKKNLESDSVLTRAKSHVTTEQTNNNHQANISSLSNLTVSDKLTQNTKISNEQAKGLVAQAQKSKSLSNDSSPITPSSEQNPAKDNNDQIEYHSDKKGLFRSPKQNRTDQQKKNDTDELKTKSREKKNSKGKETQKFKISLAKLIKTA